MLGIWILAWTTLLASDPQPVPVAADYCVRSWGARDGLPQNSVTAILQTHDGYVWLGTFNGLVRFDGLNFTTFNVANQPGLVSDSVSVLLEDHLGRIWAGTDGGGITCIHRGTFTTYIPTNTPGASVVGCLAEDSNGGIWAGTDNGVFQFVEGRWSEVMGPATGGAVGRVTSVCRDSQGLIWVAASQGTFVVEHGQLRSPNPPSKAFLLAPLTNGVLAVGGANPMSTITQGVERLLPGWEGPVPGKVVVAPDGTIWGAEGGELTRWSPGHCRRYSIADLTTLGSVGSIFVDLENNIWLGINGGGLVRLQRRVIQTISTRNALPGDDVVALIEPSPGQVWIGGFGLGIGSWDATGYHRLPWFPEASTDLYAFAQGKGRIWVGGRDGRLYRCEGAQVTSVDRIPKEGCRVVFEDRDGGLWLGGRQDGLIHRQGSTERVYSTAQGLSHGYVTAIAQDGSGAIWVGTKHGLNRILEGRITVFDQASGLGANCIHTLYTDTDGVLWVGTTGGGLARHRAGTFEVFSSRHGLPNDVVAQIVEDGHGYLWIGSNAGIFRVAKREILDCMEGRSSEAICAVYDRESGMINEECAGSFQPSCLRAADGRLWFATVGGVVIIDPSRLQRNQVIPEVHVESVRLDERECWRAPVGGGASSEVHLAPGWSRLEIGYTACAFVAPDQVRFRTRLKGLEEEWVKAGRRRAAHFSRLAPGRYEFQVTACNSEGVWRPQGTSMAIIVDPFWWETLAFRFASMAVLGIGLALTAWLLHRNRLRRALVIEAQNNARLRVEGLAVANAQLQARTRELEVALGNVRTLSGLIPICASCKKIRNDDGYWDQVETFVQQHSQAQFSHGICPECIQKLYPGDADD